MYKILSSFFHINTFNVAFEFLVHRLRNYYLEIQGAANCMCGWSANQESKWLAVFCSLRRLAARHFIIRNFIKLLCLEEGPKLLHM